MPSLEPRALYAPERHAAILAEAKRVGRVEVAALAESLGVTPETVRRDLTALERLGELRRVHGGALLVQRAEFEPSLVEREARLSDEKHRIALRALQELRDDATVLLDSGTTTAALASLVPPDAKLTAVTNSLNIANLLLPRRGVGVCCLGGRVRPVTGAAVGEWTLAALAGVCVDVAFLGANGFSLARGFTTPDQVEAAAKRAMVAAARRVIVLADSSKVGQDSLHRFATAREVAMLITDTGLDDETAAELDEAGIEVVRV
ncbi:MAG: DeoR/GlpR family DNA-binding transcription regulator [Propionibacteriaceae bacterium]|nr:DeoR/GlpR family DNA-binding transcription regulator [Propionibacteriaceae bacterium]